jgi:hypothetical protein
LDLEFEDFFPLHALLATVPVCSFSAAGWCDKGPLLQSTIILAQCSLALALKLATLSDFRLSRMLLVLTFVMVVLLQGELLLVESLFVFVLLPSTPLKRF